MSDSLASTIKLKDGHTDDEQHIYEVDENQENNGLKRQRIRDGDGVQMLKIRTKSQQQTCASDQTTRCLSTIAAAAAAAAVAVAAPATTTESPTNNATNGTIQLKGGTHMTHSNNVIKSNRYNHYENGRDSILPPPSDDCNILANLCGNGKNEGYFDSMVSSDLSVADMKLAEEKEKCIQQNHFINGDNQHSDHCDIGKGQRRTRAHSTDSIQAEFYQARKQQLRLQSQIDSDVSWFFINSKVICFWLFIINFVNIFSFRLKSVLR